MGMSRNYGATPELGIPKHISAVVEASNVKCGIQFVCVEGGGVVRYQSFE